VTLGRAIDRTRPFPVAEKAAYFTSLEHGDKVKSPFRVSFAVSGMGVSPLDAGKIEGTGQHHILIDMDLPVDIKKPITFDKPDELNIGISATSTSARMKQKRCMTFRAASTCFVCFLPTMSTSPITSQASK
jgi:hypothetical protein